MNLLKNSTPIVIGIVLIPVALMGDSTHDSSPIAVKGRANAYASLAANGAFAVVAWGARTNDGVTDIYAAASADGGRTFATPTRVNQVAGDANLSGEQPPRVALVPRAGRHPSIVVVWTAKAPAGARLLSARSEDGAKSFCGAGSRSRQ